MDERKPRESRAAGADPDAATRRWHRGFFCEKRRWSECESEIAMQSWLRRYRSSRAEQTNPEKPTTSKAQHTKHFDNQRRVQLNASLESDEATVMIAKPLKSIMKSGTQAKPPSTVRFELPPTRDNADQRTKQPSLLDRLRRLRERPACRLLTSLIFCVVLPCCLIYVGIHYANKLNTRKVAFFRGKSFT